MFDRRAVHIRLLDYYHAPDVKVWLTSPHPQLEDQKPIDLIGCGRAEEVHKVLDRLDADAYI